MDNRAFGQRLKKYRKARNFTQKQLAEKIDVTPSYIGHFETGFRMMAIEKLIKICAVLSCTPDNLICDSLIVCNPEKDMRKQSLGKELMIKDCSTYIAKKIIEAINGPADEEGNIERANSAEERMDARRG